MFKLNLTAKVYKYIAIFAVVTSSLFAGYAWHSSEVQKAVNSAKTALDTSWRVTIDEQRKRLVARSEASQRDMQAKLNQTQKVKQNEAKKLESELADLRSSLQQRPERTTNSAGGSTDSTTEAGSAQGATGMQLSKSDAEFLARFSGMAGELQNELNACIKDYENMRNELIEYVGK